MILRKETETYSKPPKPLILNSLIIRMNDTPQGDGNIKF